MIRRVMGERGAREGWGSDGQGQVPDDGGGADRARQAVQERWAAGSSAGMRDAEPLRARCAVAAWT